MWYRRELEKTVRAEAFRRPAVLLTGSRQAGKTSLLRRALPSYTYLSLDLPRIAEEAEAAGEAFLARHSAPLIVDEVQHAPGLFPYLKAAIDGHRDRMGQFILSGSQKFGLMAGVTESLAGRISILECHSLSAAEYGLPVEPQAIVEWIWRGGYPEIHARGLDVARFYADYVATYLQRDVRQVIEVRNLRDFDRFVRLAAARTGQLANAQSIASDLGVSPNTVRAWLSVLETSNVVFMLPPYFRNLGKRIVKTPKLYFADTGLASFLLGLRSPEAVRESALFGALFETFAIGQVVRWFAHRGVPADLCFYRDHDGREVDLVVTQGEKAHLFEVKWSEIPPRRVRGFDVLSRALGPDNVLSRTVLNPVPGFRPAGRRGYALDDPVNLSGLADTLSV